MSTNDAQHAQTNRRGLRRREALAAVGGLGLGGLFGIRQLRRAVATDDEAAAASSCVLTPEVTEGPYWIENGLTRRDIRAGKPGLPLEIVFTVQNAKTCKAIENADVEIWHCDAGGIYSGWYRGRTPHVHLKVHVGGQVVHTGQVFFGERITAAVYRRAPYKSHGRPDTRHAADAIFAAAGKSKAVLALRRRRQGKKDAEARSPSGLPPDIGAIAPWRRLSPTAGVWEATPRCE